MSIPRAEYPRPQWVRDAWVNLNGPWQFAFDFGCTGRDREMTASGNFDKEIIVPFCPETPLSGIEYKDFMPAIWYRRTVTIPAEWAGQRVLIRFGAVDYDTEVWVNGNSAGTHRGGYCSFSLDITAYLQAGENVITVCAEDDTRSSLQPTGKQSGQYGSHGCHYTRTTGIWQTVWLEAVPQVYLGRPKMTPDLENGIVYIDAPIVGVADGLELQVVAVLEGKNVGQVTANASGHHFLAALPISDVQPWSPESPTLYDLTFTLSDAKGTIDVVTSYIGLRSLAWDGPALLLNGKPVFQRLILDQGFYPDGLYTAPNDAELRGDIERSQAMGFNGARLHQKVFEERFLYWADKLGYLVWGEMADWGLDLFRPETLDRFLTEWRTIVARDYNHPAIVGWCPFNERGSDGRTGVVNQVYHITKQMDNTRPVLDTSGYLHDGDTDVYDSHDYDQNPESFTERHAAFANGGKPFINNPGRDAAYQGQPYFVSEYGGIWWNPNQQDDKAWGYGDRPKNLEDFFARFKGLTEALLQHPRMCGLCYTQLTDVEQEVNGLYTYDRKPKFDAAIIKAIMSQKAAIEE
ncbi:MAG: sugar-binding domain-containing protein [bacterium]